jgi:hypothetical protein
VGAASPGIERSDQSIFKVPGSVLQGKSSIEDLLLVLNFEGVSGEKILEMRRSGRKSPSSFTFNQK